MNAESGGRRQAVKRLNAALVEEILRVCMRRGPPAREARRADLIAERIVRLGGAPDYSSLRPALRGRALSARRETTRA